MITDFTKEFMLERSQEIGNKFLAWTLETKPCPISINDTYWFKKLCGLFETQALLEQRIAELEQERRWISVRDYPSQVGWYRVITNNGTEQIREYVREPDRDIHYWDVKDGEWIMMYTNPPLPQPPSEGL